MPTAGHGNDEQTIRWLNGDCFKAHDIGDLATLDRIEDADFTLSGDLEWSASSSTWMGSVREPASRK
jgi:hypothetical protein